MENIYILVLLEKGKDYISITSLIISLIALWITWKTFGLKIGDKYKTLSYSCLSSLDTKDNYISSITIQNLKDKPLVVFKIYFQLGYNIFIELEDFEKKPLIIKPFEIYQGNYGPILFYSDAGLQRYNINKLFEDSKLKNKVILETVEGKYKQFYVLRKFFKNYYTGILQPFRCFHNNISFGDNIDYIINFVYENGKKESLGIYKNDFKVFKNIKLEEKILEKKEQLEKYLNKQRKKISLTCKKIEVIDWKKEINHKFNYDNLKIVDIPKDGFLSYYILGFFYTFIQKIKTKLINSKIYKKFKKITNKLI